MGRRVIRENKSESGETTSRFENRDGIGENARSTLVAPELDGNVAVGDADGVPVREEVEAARVELDNDRGESRDEEGLDQLVACKSGERRVEGARRKT